MGEWNCKSTILDLGSRWRWIVGSTSRPLYCCEKSPGFLWIGGCMGPRAGLDRMEKWIILPLPGTVPWTSRSYLVAIRLSHPEGRAVAQRLDAGFPPRRPGFAYGQHVGFVVDKAALGQVFSEYFGFPCQSFYRFLHYHNHLGLTQ
jgi:hypothetical protein